MRLSHPDLIHILPVLAKDYQYVVACTTIAHTDWCKSNMHHHDIEAHDCALIFIKRNVEHIIQDKYKDISVKIF